MNMMQAISSAIPTPALQSSEITEQSQSTDSSIFGNMMHALIQQTSALDTQAQTAVSGLLSGKGVDVHEAMIATQKAELAFDLSLQLRNKAVSAYQQMMQMQF